MKKFVLIGILFFIVSTFFIHKIQFGHFLSAVEKSESTLEMHEKVYSSAPKETLMTNGSRQYCISGIQSEECFFNSSDALNFWIKRYLNPNSNNLKDKAMVDEFEIQDVTIFPFFNSLQAARESYLNHLEAWIDFLENKAVCDNYDKCFNKTNEIVPTFRIANKLFLSALWPLESRYLKDRIDVIFKD